ASRRSVNQKLGRRGGGGAPPPGAGGPRFFRNKPPRAPRVWGRVRGRGARRAPRGGSRPLLHRQQALALHALAGELARAADRFRLLTRLPFRGFFVVAAKFHLAENPLALHLLLQRLEGLVDIVVADENLHAWFLFLPISSMYRSPPIRHRSAPARAPHGPGV